MDAIVKSDLVKFDIVSRWNGNVIFTAEIKCDASTSYSVKLGLAVKSADLSGANLRSANLSGANLSGAYLSGADLRSADLRSADLSGANLSGAYLSGANLRSANLRSADLRSADLSGADLRSAYISGADLGSQWIIQGAYRSDGYPFFLQKLTDDKEPMIKAGCRYFTVEQAQQHWTKTRGETPLGKETENIVRSLIELARIRKLIP
jgi:hypothetical protein